MLDRFLIPVISILFSAIVSIIATTSDYWSKDRSSDIEMVRISLAILSGENKETSEIGRKFALRALRDYSKVAMTDAELEEWAKNGTIPELPYLMSDATRRRMDDWFNPVAEALVQGYSLPKPPAKPLP